MNPEWVGLTAAVLTTIAYIPQVLKVYRHRHTHSISLGMYALLTCGIGLWAVFGVLIESPSVIIANTLCFLMALYILVMKIRLG